MTGLVDISVSISDCSLKATAAALLLERARRGRCRGRSSGRGDHAGDHLHSFAQPLPLDLRVLAVAQAGVYSRGVDRARGIDVPDERRGAAARATPRVAAYAAARARCTALAAAGRGESRAPRGAVG